MYYQQIQIEHIESEKKRLKQKTTSSYCKICAVQVFKSKKKLKAKNISITESLTVYRMGVLNEAREKFGHKNVWTYDGRILYTDNNGGQKIKIYYEWNLYRGVYGYLWLNNAYGYLF